MNLFKKLLGSPETKIELWCILILTPLITAFGTLKTNIYIGWLIGFVSEITQLVMIKILIRLYYIINDMKILEPVQQFLKDPADRNGIIISYSQYRVVLESLASQTRKKFHAVCTILPSEFMNADTSRYREIQEKISKKLNDKKRVLIRSKEDLRRDNKLKEFIDWHRKVEFELYWEDPNIFQNKPKEFTSAELPFEPEDLVIFDKWLVNGNREGSNFRINYCDQKNILEKCQNFFNGLLTHQITDYNTFKEFLENDP
jgi:sRNA-binding regulator protein Hfq